MAVKMPQPQQQVAVQQNELEKAQEQHLQEMQVDATQALVNEYVDCATELEPFKPMIKAVEDNRKKLQLIAAEHPADQSVTIHGTQGRSVTFKPAGEGRKITDMNGLIGALKAKMKYEDLMNIISIPLTEIDKVLSPTEQAKFIKKVESSRVLGGFTKKSEEQG